MGSAVGEVTPRFHELVPGSAELKFTANLEQFSLKQKVARYLVLHHLEGLISGDSQLGLSQDSEVEKSLEIITSPSADTVLSHRRLGSSFLETIDWSSDNEQNYAVEDIHDLYGILGFQSGLIKDSSKIELKLFPSQSVLVSALDDGGGNAPAGIDLTARQLYKPAKYYLIRKTFKRRLHYYLKEVALLNPKEGLFISEIPSSVVRGAFQKNLKLRLHWDSAGVLFLEDTKIGAHKESNKAAAETWIQHLSAVYRNIELSKIDFEPKDWIRPQKLPRAYELERVLVSLHFLGGNAALPDLTEAINDRFVAYVRENNTMRAANKHPDLINVDKGKNIISLTANGRAYVNIFIGLGGAVEYTSQYCGVVQSDS